MAPFDVVGSADAEVVQMRRLVVVRNHPGRILGVYLLAIGIALGAAWGLIEGRGYASWMPIQIRIGLVIVAAVSAVIVVLAAVIAVVTRFEVASVLGPDKIRTLPTLMHAVVPSLRRRSVKDLDVGAATLRTWVTKGRPNLRHFRFKSPSCVVAFALPAAGLAKDWEERWEQAQRFLAERDGPVAI